MTTDIDTITYSPEGLMNWLDETGNEWAVEPVGRLLERVAARGDGLAVYRNEDLSSRHVGAIQVVSYGSADAQLEVDEPPVQLPDIGGAINWRYRLACLTERGAA